MNRKFAFPFSNKLRWELSNTNLDTVRRKLSFPS